MWIWIIIVVFIGPFILGLITHKECGEQERKPRRKSLREHMRDDKLPPDFGSGWLW